MNIENSDVTNLGDPRITTIRLSSLSSPEFRMDAKHYQEEFILATTRVLSSGYEIRRTSTLANAFLPKRIKLVTVSNPGAGAPYLRAHDVFMTRPATVRHVSATRTPEYESYLIREGMILTPSSGRNLGPIAYVGSYLAGYAMTDIMRIVPNRAEDGFYMLAFFLTPTAQSLIRRGRTGTTVDHLSPDDVLKISVVWLPRDIRVAVSERMKRAEKLLDDSRRQLDEIEKELHDRARLFLPIGPKKYLSADGPRVFGLNASRLLLRLDAAFYDPIVQSCRDKVRKVGGASLGSCAELRMLGRYKRYYVKAGHGSPILSGRQLLQLRPVNLEYISDRSFSDPPEFRLHVGWSLFTCDGRSEEALGAPAYVSSLWNGWMASNHVMRAIPRPHVRPGYLYIALRSPYVQVQLKACATGSVVDALDPTTVSNVMLPMLKEQDCAKLGEAAESAWERIAEGVRLSESTVSELDSLIVSGYERRLGVRDAAQIGQGLGLGS